MVCDDAARTYPAAIAIPNAPSPKREFLGDHQNLPAGACEAMSSEGIQQTDLHIMRSIVFSATFLEYRVNPPWWKRAAFKVNLSSFFYGSFLE